jgi:hypothetical protein
MKPPVGVGEVSVPVTVVPGDVLTFTAKGKYGTIGTGDLTPKSVGCAVGHGNLAEFPHFTAWSVIGMIGPSSTTGQFFCVGAGSTVTAGQAGGVLVLINQNPSDGDQYVGDVTVTWTLSHQP